MNIFKISFPTVRSLLAAAALASPGSSGLSFRQKRYLVRVLTSMKGIQPSLSRCPGSSRPVHERADRMDRDGRQHQGAMNPPQREKATMA
jgi:hypothetical protein